MRFVNSRGSWIAILLMLSVVAGCGGSSSESVGGIELGSECSSAGETTGMENGTAVCEADGQGNLVWQSINPDTGSVGGEPAAPSMRVGDSCATDGDFGFGDGMVTLCDGGRVRYALPEDMPPIPTGGYTARPDWYPTLADIFGPKVDECAEGEVVLDASFLPPEHVTRVIPAGMMIGDHVTPIDHLYVGIDTLERDPTTLTDADYLPVTAPADGWIVEVSSLGSPTSHRVTIAHGCGIVSVYMVVNRLTGVLESVASMVDGGGYVSEPIEIKKGEEFGRQRDNAMDFNVFDADSWLTGFANPYSYANGEPWKPYYTDPATVFESDVWSVFEESMQRTVAPRSGEIDHDVVGSAAGNWFVDGTIGYNGISIDDVRSATSMIPGGQVTGKRYYSWGHLSFAPEQVDPDTWIFSTGSWGDPSGDPRQFVINPGVAPLPDQLTAADGVVVYELFQQTFVPGGTGGMAPLPIGYQVEPGPVVEGYVVVQVLDDSSLAVEIVPGAEAPTGFTDAKQMFHR